MQQKRDTSRPCSNAKLRRPLVGNFSLFSPGALPFLLSHLIPLFTLHLENISPSSSLRESHSQPPTLPLFKAKASVNKEDGKDSSAEERLEEEKEKTAYSGKKKGTANHRTFYQC